MRKSLWVLLLLVLIPRAGSGSDEETILPLFLDLEQVYVTDFDRACLEGTLDGKEIRTLVRQYDLQSLDAIVFLPEPVPSGLSAYFIRLRGPFMNLKVIRRGATQDHPARRALDLWSIPLFDSAFRLGDFIHALLLQVRFTPLIDGNFQGSLRHRLKGELPPSKTGEERSMIFYLDSVTKLPAGFEFYEGARPVRTVVITSFVPFEGKQFAEVVRAKDLQGNKRSVLRKRIFRMKSTVTEIDLQSTDPMKAWNQFCSSHN